MDPYSYVTASHIRGLVLPVGQIKDYPFEQYLHRLRSASEVRLLDVTPDTSAEHFLFNPQGYPNGKLSFSFQTASTNAELSPLFDLEPWRQQMVVVGIAQDGSVSKSELEHIVPTLRKQYPNAIYYKVLVFGVQDKSTEAEYDLSGVQPIASSSFASLERAMADIASEFLCELSVYAISRKIGSFKSPALKALDEPDAAVDTAKGSKGHHARNSSLGLTKNGTFSTGLTERLKSRQQGRTKKFMGSLYLLAGRLPDALTELAEAAHILKQSYDHLWFAATLEQIGVCLLLQQFSEVPVTIPSIAKVVVDADSTGKTAKLAAKSAAKAAAAAKSATLRLESPKSGASSQDQQVSEKVAEALQTGRMALATFLPLLMETVVRFYNRCSPETEEMVPQTVFLETALRFVNLLTALRLGGGWNPASLSAIVRDTALEKNITAEGPSLATIESWTSHILSPSLSELALPPATRFMSALAKLYWRLDCKRKWSLVMHRLIERLELEVDKNEADAKLVLAGLEPVLEYVLDAIVSVYEWGTLRIDFLRHFYRLTSRTGYSSVAIKTAWQLLSAGAEVLNGLEQTQLYHHIRTERDATPSSYWDPLLLRDISIKPASAVSAASATNGGSASHRNSIIRDTDSRPASNRNSLADPPGFIYNPFESREKIEEVSIMVAGERSTVLVRLQNPYQFSLDIFELTLVDGDGNHIGTRELPLTIPPNKVSSVSISVTPEKSGTFTIGGIYAHAGGCSGQIFWLRDRSKTLAVSRHKQELEVPKCEKQAIKVQVNEGRPSLALCHNTLPKGWAMLLEGERVPFSVEVQNISKTQALVTSFGFTDSTVEPLKQAMAAPDASRADIYEFEFFLHQRRAVELLSRNSEIAGLEKARFDFSLYGKRGINNAAILLDYGADSEFTRRLRIPLNVTVFPSVELERVDIVTVGLPEHQSDLTAVLDLRNAWRETLEVTLSSTDGNGEEVARVTNQISPQKSSRFLLPLRWNGLSSEQLSQPIPSLSSRQFVVDTKTTADQTQSFWLREELLRRLSGHWQLYENEGEARQGQVDLRGLQLSKKMISVLRTESVLIKMELGHEEKPKIESSAIIRTRISNKTPKKKYGMLRLVPHDTSNLLWVGNLQRPISVEPDSEETVDLEIVPLAWGTYEWTAIYDVIGGGQAILKNPFVLEVLSTSCTV